MDDARKHRISVAFGAAAERYEDHADVQRICALTLADLAEQAIAVARIDRGPRVLEIGCGTGLLTREVARRWPGVQLVATDLAPAMVMKASGDPFTPATFLTMDGEAPHFADAHFDLILSNLAFQWFEDLSGALERLIVLLRPGGSLLFSTMGVGSFVNWRAAHAHCGVIAGVPEYPSLADLRAMLADYADGFVFDEEYRLSWGSARGLVTHLKGIGAIVPTTGRTPLTPSDMRRVVRAFDDGGARDNYHVLFARVTRM